MPAGAALCKVLESGESTKMGLHTPLFIHLFAMFCYVFLCELREPAWAVGSYSIDPPARGNIPKKFNKVS